MKESVAAFQQFTVKIHLRETSTIRNFDTKSMLDFLKRLRCGTAESSSL
jgi:hypothetical protein